MKDNREKFLIALIILSLIFSLFTIYVYSASKKEMNLSAKAAFLYEPNTKNVIYEKNKDLRLPMASTTKIMTAIVTIENADLNKTVRVNDNAIGIEGSSVYLKQGEEITVSALLYALMLQSANDAASALAYEISGSIEGFAELMNNKAKELGLKDTNFENPHGLDSENHYTTAHDLAIIAAYALKNPTFKEISSTQKTVIHSSVGARAIKNHNKLLSSYNGCIGVKTGYTKKSGRSLVSAAERGGVLLISVTIDAPDDWSDHKKLFDYGFSYLKESEPITE